MPTDEDYFKPIITKGAFNSNYIQYESMGDEDKNLLVEEYSDRMKPYLSGIINNYKTQGTWRIYSGNKTIEHKTQCEWKIQLTMKVNLTSSLPDSDETHIMHPTSHNIGWVVK